MYIASLHIEGYRNFKDTIIEFNDGVNVIIGPNNSGKSNVLRALRLVFDTKCRFRKLTINDFHRPIELDELKKQSPRVVVSATIKPSIDPEREQDDDLRVIRMWLTKLDEAYEARLSYIFELPSNEEDNYKKYVGAATTTDEVWDIIEKYFIRHYKYYLIGGDHKNRERADSESLNSFDVQSLEALRNVESDLFNSKSALLKEVLSFYTDYEIKYSDMTEDEKRQKQNEIKNRFHEGSKTVIDHLLSRLSKGKEQMLQYASKTGASFNNAEPDFKGELSEQDIYGALRLIVKYETGIDLPISHNGLGYNNLIYMSLLLAKIQADTDVRHMGENAVVFPILIIEEPEAHLHPSLQYKFLKFLKTHQSNKVRQIFVTSHSSQIAAAVSLKEIVCLHRLPDEKIAIAYPDRTFADTDEGVKSRKYVQRFLDATRCDMLFADKIILVEGIAEQLMLNVLSQYLGISLIDKHISVINIGGRYFQHFLSMFDTKTSIYAIPKKVLCLTDRDPVRKSKTGKTFSGCYPFEYDMDKAHFEYRQNPITSNPQYTGHPGIFISSQDAKFGKTFEYDLILHNPNLTMLVIDNMSNADDLKSVLECETYNDAVSIFKSKNYDWRTGIYEALEKSGWDEQEKLLALKATFYLHSIDKGEQAFNLSNVLSDNMEGPKECTCFNVPQYIKVGLEWLLK